ncbi:twin-arginine translocation pathway signal protein [Paraburkholderia silviterrae]|uniref:Twin-arginine translocation pathway signal protein n=1 Tax=Paraburkholderia silviterrae TaxID=2528715 RepID=A0A4R5M351_9BURK|nr:twin-arginine translocation pathway signal protein [Paraburkholderia silviterrae]TDG20051.1 twin-arginine translocation pathway signal protein [Paraburkholderia silviterrae]
MSFKTVRMAAVLAGLLVGGCSSLGAGAAPSASTSQSSHAQLEQNARVALAQLYSSVPRAKELRSHAVAILVFPDILKAGLMFGGSGGNGVLFSRDGKVLGYYNASAVSYGLQAGAQSFSEAMFLTKPAAERYLDSSDGWSIGAGPSVVLADSGMGRDMSSTTLRPDVYAFIFGQVGLMAGMGVQGQKITRLGA